MAERVGLIWTYIVQHDELRSPTAVGVADGVEDAIPSQGRDQLLQEKQEQNRADGCEVEVVDLEKAVQLQRRSLPHQLPSAKDDQVV